MTYNRYRCMPVRHFRLGSRVIKGRKVDKAEQATLLKGYLTKTNSHGELHMKYY